MKRLIALVVVAVALVAAGAAALPFVVSTDLVKRHVAEQISAWTGRQVTIGGEPRLSLYPYLTVRLSDVTLGNPAGIKGALIDMDGLTVKLEVLPLLLGRIEIADFELVRPHVDLRVDAKGRPNWVMDRGSVSPQTEPERPAAEKGQAPEIIRLGRFAITDGTVTFHDERTGEDDQFTAVNVEIAWPSTAEAASGTGDFIWRGEPVEFNGAVTTPIALLAGGSSPLRFAIASTPIRIAFDGTGVRLDGTQFEGKATVTTPSVRRAIEWFGTRMGAGPILGAASITGDLAWTASALVLTDATIELDGNSAEGAINVTFGAERPVIHGTLALERLDLSAYLESLRAELIADEANPVGLPLTTAVDLDFLISAGEIVAGTSQVGRAAVTATIAAGKLTLTVADALFYGGQGDARLSAEVVDGLLNATAEATLNAVPAKALLSDVAGMDAIDGTGAVEIDLAAKGRTWGEFARAISGTARIAIADGSVTGMDVAKLATLLDDPTAMAQRSGSTEFKTLALTLHVDNEAMETRDLHAEGDGYALDLNGKASLIDASVAAWGKLTIPSADETQAPAEVPFVVSGTWDAPFIFPDFGRLIRRSAVEAGAGDRLGLMARR